MVGELTLDKLKKGYNNQNGSSVILNEMFKCLLQEYPYIIDQDISLDKHMDLGRENYSNTMCL